MAALLVFQALLAQHPSLKAMLAMSKFTVNQEMVACESDRASASMQSSGISARLPLLGSSHPNTRRVMQPPPYGVPPPPPGHYAPPGHAYGYDPYARPELHGSQPAGYYAGAGYGQHDYYHQQSAYGHERHVEYGSGFNGGESRPRDHGSNADRGDRFEGHSERDYPNHQGDWEGRGDHRHDRHERGERDRDRRDRDRRDRDDLNNSAGDHGFDRRAGHGSARDDDRRDSDNRRGHEGRSDPRPPKGGGKGGRGRGGQGSRELARSRSRSRRRSSSGSSSGSPQEKKRMRKAAGFDSVTKPRETGKVPTEAAPQRGLALAPGRKADVYGLKGASQYNGCEGIVIEGPNDKGRWEVQVDYQCETKTLSLLESNLQPKPSCGWELVIAPIALGIKETDVSQALSVHGRVRHVKMTDPPGVCLAQMTLKDGAEAALQNLRRFEIKGTQVSVDWSTMAKTEMGLCNKRHQKPPDEPPPRSFKESTAQEFGFQMGQAVLISNLKGAPQFNGCTAAVVGFRSDRVEVEVEAEGTKKTLALKPDNLSASTGQAEPPKAQAQGEAAEQAPAEKAPEPRRRRGKWEENSGGFVVNQAKKGPACPKLPPLADLEAMPVKELKQVLVAHAVDITGCLERAEFLAKAKEVAEQNA
ncbi:unnamed protein product [Symbiodinium sp. KB8]|nr:unnamed protein product [Symbiodinium sp. KB8]